MEVDYKLYLGNCLDVLKDAPSDYIDLVVTSPPYDNLRTYNGYTFDFEPIADQLVRVLKPGGVIVWVVNDATVKGSETGSSFKQALHFMSLGLNLHDTMIYEKLNFVPLTHNRYEQCFEYMFVLSKGKPKTNNLIKVPCVKAGQKTSTPTFYHTASESGKAHKTGIYNQEKIKKNIWAYTTGNTGEAAKYRHPAKFPLQLALDHIQSWSNPGDLVLDPFLGSGTTGVAALQLGRRFGGIEISEEYFQLAEQRIEESLNGNRQ